jgi:hypothetical protein
VNGAESETDESSYGKSRRKTYIPKVKIVRKD